MCSDNYFSRGKVIVAEQTNVPVSCTVIGDDMELFDPISIILICGLFANTLLISAKLRDQDHRITDLEKSPRDT